MIWKHALVASCLYAAVSQAPRPKPKHAATLLHGPSVGMAVSMDQTLNASGSRVLDAALCIWA